MALDLDGKKERINKKINLKEVVGGVKQGKFRLDAPEVVLAYKMEAIVEGGEEKVEKTAKTSKEVKVIKF